MPYQIDSINPHKAAMIVVDMQNDFVAPGAPMETPAARKMVPNLARALAFCREVGIKVIYTTHVHRKDGCDAGRFADTWPPIAQKVGLVDDTPGIDIYPDLAPAPGEHIIKKHRYSGFFGTDMDIILRGWGIDTVIVSGTTTENCCHATARDAMFHNYKVAFLADATGTFDYPDVGYGAMSADQVHAATLAILSVSTAHVMTVDELIDKVK
ncbi:MAG: biuret amidohydrolase [Burkholderiales bacterium]|jgi:nicotinamidase-related amidase